MTDRIMALSVGRRYMALAVFSGLRPEHTDLHSLPTSATQSGRRATEFLRRMVQAFRPSYVILKEAPTDGSIRQGLHSSVLHELRAHSVPIQEVSMPELLSAFAIPPLTSTVQLRMIGRVILPMIGDMRLLDVCLAALYVQIERAIRRDLNH